MTKPRTEAPKGEQLTEKITGELAVYEQVGLPQHALGKKTAYRYRGVLLLYQQALNGRNPSVAFSEQYLGQAWGLVLRITLCAEPNNWSLNGIV